MADPMQQTLIPGIGPPPGGQNPIENTILPGQDPIANTVLPGHGSASGANAATVQQKDGIANTILPSGNQTGGLQDPIANTILPGGQQDGIANTVLPGGDSRPGPYGATGLATGPIAEDFGVRGVDEPISRDTTPHPSPPGTGYGSGGSGYSPAGTVAGLPPHHPHHPSHHHKWKFSKPRYIFTLLLSVLFFSSGLISRAFGGKTSPEGTFLVDGIGLTSAGDWLWVTTLVIIAFVSLPVITWEEVRPLAQDELAEVIFKKTPASKEDLYLEKGLRKDIMCLVSFLLFLYVSCVFIVNHPGLSRLFFFAVFFLAGYVYWMRERLMDRFHNHPGRRLNRMGTPRSKSYIVSTIISISEGMASLLPLDFLESKIMRKWFHLSRFMIFLTFFSVGSILGSVYAVDEVIPNRIFRAGRSSVMILAGDVGAGVADTTNFRFTYNTKIDTLRSSGWKENGHTYCVAPILEASTLPGTPMQLFAVGKDCCLARGDFWCTAGNALKADHIIELYGADTEEAAKKDWAAVSQFNKKHPSTKSAVRAIDLSHGDQLGFNRAAKQASDAFDFNLAGSIDDLVFVYWGTNAGAAAHGGSTLGTGSERVFNQLGSGFPVVSILSSFLAAILLGLAPGAGFAKNNPQQTAILTGTTINAQGIPVNAQGVPVDQNGKPLLDSYGRPLPLPGQEVPVQPGLFGGTPLAGTPPPAQRGGFMGMFTGI